MRNNRWLSRVVVFGIVCFSLRVKLNHMSISELSNSLTFSCRFVVLVACLMMDPSTTAMAADPTFVGQLSTMVRPEIAREIELSPRQLDQLNRLIDRRESEALELAISSRGLEAAARKQKLADFVTESERQGFKLLSSRQAAAFRVTQLKEKGLGALGDADVATKLDLKKEQKQQVQQLLQARDQELTGADSSRRATVRAEYERQLNKILNETQRQNWGRMTTVDRDLAASEGSKGEQVVDKVATGDPDRSVGTDDQRQAGPASGNGQLRFNFRYAPWSDVLDWFAERADLSLVLDAPPPGTFNYTDNQSYTPAQAIDLINSVLLTKGYVLVRRERMLLLINLEDGIPPNLVTTVPVSELDRRGEFELVSCLFPLERVAPEEAEEEISALIGPQGAVQVLSKAKQLLVTETAGRLRTIRDVLQAVEDPDDLRSRQVTLVDLKHVRPTEALPVIRQMMGFPEEMDAAPDGSFRMTVDPSGRRLMLKGKADLISQVENIIELVDVPPSQGILDTPQIEFYSVQSADPESVLQVVETLLADEPDVRLASDPKTGNLVAMGLPSHHATIRATLDQMERDGQSIEVLKLRYIDPQLAMLSINKLFGSGEEGGRAAPRVDADITTGQLMVRGTKSQIEQIRTLMEKMGEMDADESSDLQRSRNVRLLSMSPGEASSLLEKAGQIWPTMRKNRIRAFVPAEGRSIVPSDNPTDSDGDASNTPDGPPEKRRISVPGTLRSGQHDRFQEIWAMDDSPIPTARKEAPEIDQASLPWLGMTPISQLMVLSPQSDSTQPSRSTQENADVMSDLAAIAKDNRESVPGADIVVAESPQGLMIASRDLEALNEFEQLLLSLSEREMAGSEFAVFYLRHATAESAAAVLMDVLGGGGASSANSAPAGGGLLGSLAGAALGDAGGGLVGSLLGLDGDGGAASYSSSGSFKIISEPRLNFLIVQANLQDMQLIEAMLEVIDQRKSTVVVETIPAPRLIPVRNTSAEEIAGIVREVYANRLANGGGSQRQPSPEEFIKALRGGGGKGGGDRAAEEQNKLTIGVDKRRNSLVVAAPDALFEEVKVLVGHLDQVDNAVMEMTRVITLRKADPELVRQALAQLVGEAPSASTNQIPTSTASGGGSLSSSKSADSASQSQKKRGGSRPGNDLNEMRRGLEFMRALQQSGSGGGKRSGRGRR